MQKSIFVHEMHNMAFDIVRVHKRHRSLHWDQVQFPPSALLFQSQKITRTNVRGGAITYGVAITRGNPPNPAKMVNFTTLFYNGEEREN